MLFTPIALYETETEALHGTVRHFYGSNDHPDGAAAISAIEKLSDQN